MHFIVGRRQSLEVVGAQTVHLQLESERRFQVSIDTVFGEIVANSVREITRELATVRNQERDPSELAL